MGSALLNPEPLSPAPRAPAFASVPRHAAAGPSSAGASRDALKLHVAERLAAHRERRDLQRPQPPRPAEAPPAASRTSRITAAVAERYANSPTYRAYLAAEAERAVQQARAAAEIAALNAEAVAHAQQQLLDALNAGAQSEIEEGLDAGLQSGPQEAPSQTLKLWPEADPGLATNPGGPSSRSKPPGRPAWITPRTPPRTAAPGLTVCLFEDGAAARPLASQPAASASRPRGTHQHDAADDPEARALDEEIAFRRAPVFEEPAGPPVPLPANLIEFPRQLVAPRKARPRYAEGPLREDDPPGCCQLRIFEVDAAQISTTPGPAEASMPRWTSIWLDASAPTEEDLAAEPTAAPTAPGQNAASLSGSAGNPVPRPQTAPIPRRLMAAAVDAGLILAGFLACAAVALISAHPAALHLGHARLPVRPDLADQTLLRPSAALAAIASGLQPGLVLAAILAALVFLYLLYQTLFFSLSDATPGMRYARIALCTFADENPSRPAMRRRIFAALLATCPLGLGLLWAALDQDRLAWHDRISRMYQRSY